MGSVTQARAGMVTPPTCTASAGLRMAVVPGGYRRSASSMTADSSGHAAPSSCSPPAAAPASAPAPRPRVTRPASAAAACCTSGCAASRCSANMSVAAVVSYPASRNVNTWATTSVGVSRVPVVASSPVSSRARNECALMEAAASSPPASPCFAPSPPSAALPLAWCSTPCSSCHAATRALLVSMMTLRACRVALWFLSGSQLASSLSSGLSAGIMREKGR
mmetsp:Transcript_16911/g.42335  ORF Transcript_16911/g.42335 Transcript_16911/m.42335 type:complete len:221 (+) Transcript_16911:668-1330(+)